MTLFKFIIHVMDIYILFYFLLCILKFVANVFHSFVSKRKLVLHFTESLIADWTECTATCGGGKQLRNDINGNTEDKVSCVYFLSAY